MFIQIGDTGFNLRHIIDIRFSKESVWITTAEADGDGNMALKFTGSDAEAIKEWWEERADVHRII